ncbi:aldo/keto reductase [Comamonas sp. JC664]|uniref:aldo/keto reductase n=1 Tax=Comamonas sp. JC664 TaxID=2801917 RepID=UPI00174ACA80|nr:aldo/keto reductase [Comamonas sp. JC664]MBL0695132.1 aldo/keto reductase [Comamonas sp. JC664]GHG86345.1 oxidoreductase [Comamonas sp. KCTC 72670]
MAQTKLEARKPLGTTGIQVSPLNLGGNVFGWTADEPTSFAVLDAFLEGGGNFIDTADVYSSWVPGNRGGESETLIGKWMKARGARDRVVIATKVGSQTELGKGLGREHIQRSVEASLRRLQVDTIDLYYAHYEDLGTPVEETMAAFDALVRAGKVRALGASNHSPKQLTDSLEVSQRNNLARYTVLQPHYNLVERKAYESTLRDICEREGLVVAPYFALASGFLTGKYRKDQPPPKSARAEGVLKKYGNARGWAVIDALEEVTRRHPGANFAQVALAWLAAQPTIVAPIASATSVQQTQELLGAFTLQLTAEDLRTLDVASSREA